MQIDYRLNKKSERKEHLPDKALKAIKGPGVYRITGDNSLGKTFILNLIAYGLLLDKSQQEKLDEQVFNSIDKYNNSDEYKLSYEIKFELNGGRGICLKKDDSGQREVEVEGRVYGPEALAEEIDVVYDLPKNPIERIRDVVSNVQDWNTTLEQKVGHIFRSLESINHRLQSVRDEGLIDKLNREISKIEKSLPGVNNKIETLEAKVNNYLALQKAKEYQKVHGNLNITAVELAKAEKALKSIPRPKEGATQSQSLLKSYRLQLEKALSTFKESPIKLSDLIDNLSVYTDCSRIKAYSRQIDTKVAKWDFDYILKDEWQDEMNNVRQILKNSMDDLVVMAENFLDNDRFKERQKVKDLIDFLKSLGSDKKTKEILDKNLKAGYNGFMEELQMNLFNSNEADKVDFIINNCNKAKEDLEKSTRSLQYSIRDYLKESKKNPSSDNSSYYETLDWRDREKKRLNILQGERNQLNFELRKLINKDPDSYEDIMSLIGELNTRVDNSVSLDSIKVKLSQAKSQMESLNLNIANQKARLEDEIKKDVLDISPETMSSLRKVHKVIILIRNNLSEFRKPINAYNKNQDLTPKNNEDRAFLSIIGKMIAESINNEIIRQEGERIRVESFNLASRKFECSDGSAIPVADVSRGISSATYLVQVVNKQISDNVILLLDEMGEITDTTFEVVHDAIRRLVDRGKTVYAFATRAVDGQPLKVERL